MNNNRCVIFGGGGFIGSHLSEMLINNQYFVAVYSRKSDRVLRNLSNIIKEVEFIEGDFNDISSVEKAIKPGDIVFDLVASSVPFSSTQSPIEEINHHIFSHVRLIEACYKRKIRKIIFASSGGGIYGDRKKNPVSENENPRPLSPHAIGKITIEYYLHYYYKMFGIPYIIYRISNPYGPRQIPEKGFAIIPTLFTHVIKKVPPTLYDNGNLVRDFIYIKDLVQGIVLSFDKDNKYNIYNIGSGKGTSIRDVWEKIKKLTGSSIKPYFQPKRLFDSQSIVLDIKRFEKEYNYKVKTDIVHGLRETWKSMKKSK